MAWSQNRRQLPIPSTVIVRRPPERQDPAILGQGSTNGQENECAETVEMRETAVREREVQGIAAYPRHWALNACPLPGLNSEGEREEVMIDAHQPSWNEGQELPQVLAARAPDIEHVAVRIDSPPGEHEMFGFCRRGRSRRRPI